MSEIKTIASEQGHWYDQQGNPVYEVQAKNGNMRPTNLADARKLDLVPSVTTILRCAAQPGLDAWKATQLIEAALTLPKKPDETLDEYATRVREDAKAQGIAAASKGTELHKAIEDYIRGLPVGEWEDHCRKLTNTLLQYGIDLSKGKAEHSFSSELGYGGKIDWHDNEVVLDFKTKAIVGGVKQLGYQEHCWQLAAYRKGLELTGARLINVFVGISDCEFRIHEWNEEDAEQGWKAFRALLDFWQITKKWNGGKQ